MTFFDAAVSVLSAARRPLTTREIVESATSRGLLKSAGKTPEASMSAQLYRRYHDPDSPIQRLAEQGPVRARHGTVRWALDSTKLAKKSATFANTEVRSYRRS
jgi:hypothetical protein